VWAAKGLESPREVVGCDEVGQVRFELFVGVIEEALDGGFLDGPVHPFDLSVGPGMVGLGQTVSDAMTKTDAIEGVSTPSCRKASTVLRQIGELDSVVGEHSVDAIRNGPDECFEEGGGRLHIRLFNEFDHSELRGPELAEPVDEICELREHSRLNQGRAVEDKVELIDRRIQRRSSTVCLLPGKITKSASASCDGSRQKRKETVTGIASTPKRIPWPKCTLTNAGRMPFVNV
jgi:hypothetical protein